MKTKLVYVLTCSANDTYIEQGLMSTFSARYHNPDAHIVLVTDNLTSAIMHNTPNRSEIFKYITEEVVISFEDDKNMHYRSRWLKTNLRNLIDGDYLFIDCDTIIQRPLLDIDDVNVEIGAVLDGHMYRNDYSNDLNESIERDAQRINYDYTKDTQYFNSGVMFVQDTKTMRELYRQWHEEWTIGEQKGVRRDQPSLGKVNQRLGYPIRELDGRWDCLAFMRPAFLYEAYIIHYWTIRKQSLMYGKPFLIYVKEHGLDEYVRDSVLHSTKSLLPFNNIWTSMPLSKYVPTAKVIAKQIKQYFMHIDDTPFTFPWQEYFTRGEKDLLNKGYFVLASYLYVLRKFTRVHLQNKKDNWIISY